MCITAPAHMLHRVVVELFAYTSTEKGSLSNAVEFIIIIINMKFAPCRQEKKIGFLQ